VDDDDQVARVLGSRRSRRAVAEEVEAEDGEVDEEAGKAEYHHQVEGSCGRG
jgi:hypothetical protein